MSKTLKEILRESKRIVAFTGAGCSTESGLPDFRSADGIYQEKQYPYPPETMLSHTFFMQRSAEFYDFYFHKMIYPDAKPNPAHYALARLEQQGKLTAVITQNIDGLHQKAGSQKVLELHGSVERNTCMKCGRAYSLEEMLMQKDGVPRCSCGGIIKPDVVLYEEGLDEAVLQEAVWQIRQADTMIVGGTSLAVYPAAGLVRYFRGKNLILINKSATGYDSAATMIIRDSIGKVLAEAVEE